MASQSSWERLRADLLEMIVIKLHNLDAARVSAVCSSWRAFMKTSRVLYRPLPLAIREQVGVCGSYQLTDRTCSFPGGRMINVNAAVLHMEHYHASSCVGSSRKMLVLQESNADIVLLNPFSRKSFRFPPLSTLYRKKVNYNTSAWSAPCEGHVKFDIHKAVVVVPSNFEKNKRNDEPKPILVMIYNPEYINLRVKIIAYCNMGSWLKLDASKQYEDIVAREKHLLFAMSISGSVTAWDFGQTKSGAKPAKVLSFVPSKALPMNSVLFQYLVESPGGLLLVRKLGTRERNNTIFHGFDVYKSRARSGDKWEEVENLGDDKALFLGKNESALVSSLDLPRGCKGNSIYFSDQDSSSGVYSLTSKATVPHRKLSGEINFFLQSDESIWMV